MVPLLLRHVQEMADFIKVGSSYETTGFVWVVRDYMAGSGNVAAVHRFVLSGHLPSYRGAVVYVQPSSGVEEFGLEQKQFVTFCTGVNQRRK